MLITESFWLWPLLGRLHPLIVHFPVSLLCVALLLEGLGWFRQSTAWQAGTTALVWLGAGSAVVAAGLGLVLVNQDEYRGDTVTIHQWAGLATMVLAVGTALALRAGRVALYRSLLTATVVGVTLAGHYGALVTHGDDYLTSVWDDRKQAPLASGKTPFALASTGQPPDRSANQ